MIGMAIGCTLGSFFGAALATWLSNRSRAERENRLMRAWLKRLDGPVEQAGPYRESLTVARVALDRLEPPPPTSVPGPGRRYEE